MIPNAIWKRRLGKAGMGDWSWTGHEVFYFRRESEQKEGRKRYEWYRKRWRKESGGRKKGGKEKGRKRTRRYKERRREREGELMSRMAVEREGGTATSGERARAGRREGGRKGVPGREEAVV